MDLDVLKVIEQVTGIVKNVIGMLPDSTKQEITAKFKIFANNEGGRNLNNILALIQAVGIVFVGFMFAFLMIVHHPDVKGIISGFLMFGFFSTTAIFLFRLAYRKFIHTAWPPVNRM